MAYINDKNLTLAHIDALIALCGFTSTPSNIALRVVQTDNGETIHLTSLPGALDYLVHQLVIRRTMAQLANIT